jgi:acyl carrier protein
MNEKENRTQDIAKPQTNMEIAIAALWQEALQLPNLPSSTDNFFALGGDSMTMTMVEFRIKEELHIDLPAGAMLNAQSLRELSILVKTNVIEHHRHT